MREPTPKAGEFNGFSVGSGVRAANLETSGRLPALQDDDLWVGGFENIVDHLRARKNRSFNLDGSLSPTEKAEVTA